MLIRQARQKRVIFVTINIFYIKGSSFNQMSVLHHLMMSMNLSDIAILNIRSGDYCCIIKGISKREAINLMQNIDLTEKNEKL